MAMYKELGLTTYMNRDSYLSSFNSVDELQDEINYVEYRLAFKIPMLERAVLELKLIDLKNKISK